jgi:hypothetical protein
MPLTDAPEGSPAVPALSVLELLSLPQAVTRNIIAIAKRNARFFMKSL